jgi:hypothetical protein
MTVKIIANDRGNPAGKLADAELHFTDGPLSGLKMIGFAIWERRGSGGPNVTFPARQYSVNGERRSFALLRPLSDPAAHNQVRQLILDAFVDYEEQAAITQEAGGNPSPRRPRHHHFGELMHLRRQVAVAPSRSLRRSS